MTSNLGADLIRKSTTVGFGAKEGALDYDMIKEKIEDAIKKQFKPEFINRVDDVVIFRPLSKEFLMQVIELEVKKVQNRLERKEIYLTLDDKAKNYLVEKGFQPEMGARPLRRIIEQYLEDPLAEKILMNPDEGRRTTVTIEDDKLIFKDKEVFRARHTIGPIPNATNEEKQNEGEKEKESEEGPNGDNDKKKKRSTAKKE